MRKKIISIYCSILFVILQVLAVLGAGIQVSALDVDDFYFDRFEADYYLSRDTDGISRLKVVESLRAVFPDYPQNKGICRRIPFTNSAMKNITLPNLTTNNITLTRNGATEPIYSIDKINNYYEVCTGTDEYVTGVQEYKLEYDFVRVVTDFGEYQELYWDTNGNGWLQNFNSVVARVHFVGDVVKDFAGDSWCYVGVYGEGGQERCEISSIEDGVMFEARNLTSGENLTFDLQLKPGSFVVPEPEKNYILILALAVVAVICGGAIFYVVRKYLKNKDKEDYCKGYFVKPEYQPSNIYSLEELAELYMGKKKDIKVAVFLDLIVRKRIELISLDKKKWAFKVLDLEDTGKEERILLAILNGGDNVEVGKTVLVDRQKSSVTLVELGRDFYSTIRKGLVSGGLVGKNYTMGETHVGTIAASLIVNLVFVWPILTLVAIGMIFGFAQEYATGLVVFESEFPFAVGAILFVTILIWSILNNKANRFKNITKKGIEAEKYMEGLEMYIRMAEKDRIEFLQSVDKVDVSAKSVVKLYEKLLPYAAVFGLEKTWMEEMEQYCKVHEIEEPNYLLTGMAVSEISRAMSATVAAVNSATMMSSGGGGSSSGFSGGGGGGFSGGGGGGGGGGGR